jgi:hypothetical protein
LLLLAFQGVGHLAIAFALLVVDMLSVSFDPALRILCDLFGVCLVIRFRAPAFAWTALSAKAASVSLVRSEMLFVEGLRLAARFAFRVAAYSRPGELLLLILIHAVFLLAAHLRRVYLIVL